MNIWTIPSSWSSDPPSPSCFTSLGFQPPPQSHICHSSHFPTHLLLKATFHTLLHFICASERVPSPPFLQLHYARLTEGSAQMYPASEIFRVFNLGWIFLPELHDSYGNKSHFSDIIVYIPNSLQQWEILRIQSGL